MAIRKNALAANQNKMGEFRRKLGQSPLTCTCNLIYKWFGEEEIPLTFDEMDNISLVDLAYIAVAAGLPLPDLLRK
jgi:hypothetical protein